MAVTGDIFKSLTFDGESSRDYGVYITGQAVYNAPERDVEMVTIPGRNGAFALDKGRFENIEVTYPAGVFANTDTEFAKAISDFRNMLCSRQGYCRLTDEYNPDEYRLAVYKSGLEVDPVQLKAGQFDITFECKPQRYLMSGQNKFIVGEWGDTNIRTGERIQIDNTSGMLAVKSAEVALEPKQAGTPWQDSTVYNTPFLFRKTPSVNHSINSKYTTLVGADVAVNQRIKYPTSGTTYSGVTFSHSDGVMTLSGQASAGYINCFGSHSTVKDHIYLITSQLFANPNNISVTVGSLNSYITATLGNSVLYKETTSRGYDGLGIQAYGGSGTDLTGIKFWAILVDITAYFGLPSIADTAYAKEQATLGSGIAWLKSQGFDFSKYIEQNAGSLEAVNPSAIVDRGFNQWDEEWEVGTFNWTTGEKTTGQNRIRSKNYIPVIPNTQYYFKAPNTVAGGYEDLVLAKYDANKNYLGFVNISVETNPLQTMPSDCYYIMFATITGYGETYNHDICINLHWDGSRDGEYEKYIEHEYDLGNVPLHGVFKGENGNIVAYGDVRTNDGTRTHNFGQVDLGTLNYTYDSSVPKFYTTGLSSVIKTVSGAEVANVISPQYVATALNSIYNNPQTGMVGVSTGGAITFINTAYSDAAAFKTAMSGVMLTYELATPTTDTTDPFTNPQVVDNWGTEEFVTSNDVPVGNQTRYADVYEITGTDEVDFHVSHQGNITTDDIEIGKNAAGGTVPECARLIVYDALGGEDYHIVFPIAGFSRMNFIEYDADGNPLSNAPATTDIDMTITLEPTTDKVIVEWHKATAITESDFEGYEFQIGEIYTTSLGATVYKGTQEMVSGECAEEWTGVKVKNLTWTLWGSGASSTFRATISDRKEGKTNLMCEAYPVTDEAQTSMIDSTITGNASSSFVYIRDTAFSTVAELKATMGECLILYELDTSTTRSLTGHDIELINNRNMLWSDQGIITVEYGTGPDFIVNPTLFGCGPLIETKGYGNISFNGHTISLANGAIGTVNLWSRTSGGSLNGSITKTFATGQFNPTDTFSFTVSHMFTLYEDNPSIVNTNVNAVNDFRDNNDGSVTYWIDLPCTFTINTTGQITNESTYTFGSKEVIANMTVSYNSTTGTVVYSVTTDTVNNPEFASTTQFGFTISDCNATSTLDRLGDPTYIDCDLGEAYKINDGDVVSLNSFVDLGSKLPELAPGANLFSVDNTFTEVAVVPRWWTV